MGKMGRVLGVVMLLMVWSAGSEAILYKESATAESATAGEAAKEYAKEAVRNTADAAANVGESVKQTANAAYETTANAAKTLTGGRSDRATDGPTGAAYRDRSGNYITDTVAATQRKAADAAAAVRDSAAGTAQAARNTASRAYDATADTVGNVKDRVRGPPEPEPSYTQRAADAARRASQNVRDGASRAYDTTTGSWGYGNEDNRGMYDKARDAVTKGSWGYGNEDNRGMYDKARDAVTTGSWGDGNEDNRGMYDKARDAVTTGGWGYGHEDKRGMYDKARDAVTTGGWGCGNEDNRGMYDKARDTVSRAGQATRDSTYRAVGYQVPDDRSYASRAYGSVRDSSSDAYEAGKNRLGSIIEILGWHRAPDDEQLRSRYSPYDVIVGSRRYVWHQQPEPSYYQSAKDTVGSATQTVADKAREGANTVYDAAGRTKDVTVESASRASESVKDVAGRTGETVSDYSQMSKDALNARAAAVEEKIAKPGFIRKLGRFLHLLTWGVAFGTAVWMTFMSGRILQQNMPREQFRTVQTKMFPSYLRFLTAGEGVLLVFYTFMSHASKWQILSLLILVGSTAYNAYVLEPQTTKIYLNRLKLEKEEGRGLSDAAAGNANEELTEKNKKFRELHGYSASLNLLSLGGLAYHAWDIVSRLHA